MPPDYASFLAGYIHPPTVRAPVRAYIRQLGAPFMIHEIWRPLGLPRMVVQRELYRMLDEGLLTRHKVPTRGHAIRNDGTVIPDGSQRMVFLYTPTEAFA